MFRSNRDRILPYVGSTFGASTGFGATSAPSPAAGGGLFGSTSTGFGAKPATTGFGAPAAPTGNTGGLFGAKPAGTGLFGAAAAPAGAPGESSTLEEWPRRSIDVVVVIPSNSHQRDGFNPFPACQGKGR
jgi:hypothetical protein